MAKQVLDNQCPNCLAPLFFNAKEEKFICDYCDSSFSMEEFNKRKGKQKLQVNENDAGTPQYVSYHCPDCGAEIIADENTASTFCLYCGNASILKDRLSGTFKPDKILLFKTEKKEAIDAFKGLSKGRILMPSSFNKEENIEKITGLYVPFWLYDVIVTGNIEVDAKDIKTWTAGDTHYTKTDTYKAYRSGGMQYNMIPVDGSTRFPNDIMNTIEPFNFKQMVDYQHEYLSGYLAEKYDVSSEDAFIDAENRALKNTEEEMLKDVKGYTTKVLKTKNFHAENSNAQYALLPVWMVNVKYKDKYYIFAMNGQTGEFVGNIPLDIKKTIFLTIGMFVGVFLFIIFMGYIIFVLGGK